MKKVKDLTDDELRILILQYFGWKDVSRNKNLIRGIDPKDGVSKITPNYTKNLNVMRELEKTLPPDLVYDYMIKLSLIMRHPVSEKGKLHTYLFHASARERAEAFAVTNKLSTMR